MRRSDDFRLPPEQKKLLGQARKLERITFVYMLSVVAAIYVTMGSSQAMKAAWLEDILTLLPPIAFLIANNVFDRQATAEFPYGFHRSVNIGFLVGAVALMSMGAFITFDSFMGLAKGEHPSIGGMVVFGHHIWQGWVMIAALLWGIVPAIILGRKKLPLAEKLHDKQLQVEAKMQKADWLTGVTGIAGIIGIGFGLWWADSVAAIVIGLDVLHDGVKNTRAAVADLMDATPTSPDRTEVDPVVREAQDYLRNLHWVEHAEVRLREEGHVFRGEGYVVPRSSTFEVERLEEAREGVKSLSWKLHEFDVVPVREIPHHLRAEDPPLAVFEDEG